MNSLTAALTSSATSASVAEAPNSDYILVDDELIAVTAGKTTTSLTISRGELHTDAVAHDAGVAVYSVISYLSEPLGVNVDYVGSDGTVQQRFIQTIESELTSAGGTVTGPIGVGSPSSYISDNNDKIDNEGGVAGVSAYISRLGGGEQADWTATWRSVVADDPDASQSTISDATNASPIVITTTAPHEFADGMVVAVGSVGGNTAANGKWVARNVTSTTFELEGSTGNGAYTSGGKVTSAGNLRGLSVVVAPTVTRVLNSSGAGAAAFGDDVLAAGVYNAGTAMATVGFNVGRNTANFPSSAEFQVGFGVDGYCTSGISFTSLSRFFGAGINLTGIYDTYGIDFYGATSFGVGMQRWKPGQKIVVRNTNNDADLDVMSASGTGALTVYQSLIGNGLVVAGGTAQVVSNTIFEVQGPNATTDPLAMIGSVANGRFYTLRIRNSSGQSQYFIAQSANDGMTGTASGDSGAGTLSTSKWFHIGGSSSVIAVSRAGALKCFNTGSGATIQTVTGAKGSNAALGSLLAALAAYGLIVDSSSA